MPRTLGASLLSALAVATLALTTLPLPDASALVRDATCRDRSGVSWRVSATWGASYVDAAGVRRARLEKVRWTTDKRTVPTDSIVRTVDGKGRQIQELRWTGRMDYRGGTAWRTRHPADPALAGGRQTKVTVRLGRDGDGRAGCTVTLRGPGAPSPALPSKALAVEPQAPVKVRSLAFADDFSGHRLDTDKWAPCWFPDSYRGSDACGSMNRSRTLKSNVTVEDGYAVLTQSGRNAGALISSNPGGGAGTGFEVTDGYYVEARVLFPGSGRTIYNWPAWWLNGAKRGFDDGEADIAEGLGRMTSNYHCCDDASLPYGRKIDNSGTIAGSWAGGYHTYGLDRQDGKNVVYFDGRKIREYATHDGGAPQYLIFNVGTKDGRTQVYGKRSQVRVDYVRVWRR